MFYINLQAINVLNNICLHKKQNQPFVILGKSEESEENILLV